MRDLVEFLARALVEDPDSVQVEEVEENGDLVLEVTVGPDDLGRLIGKGGRVANAIRTIAKAASAGADTLDECSLRDKIDGDLLAQHLPLRRRVQADMRADHPRYL